MRILLITLAAATLAGAPALAQHNRAAPSPSRSATAQAAPTHEMCKALMGAKMQPKAVHDHGGDKTGAPTWPNGKPLTQAEMDAMHKRCAERMARAEGPAR